MFSIFKKRYSPTEIWKKRVEAFIVGTAIILFWRGVWGLADMYLYPQNHLKSYIVSILIGMGILMFMRSFVSQFLDEEIEELGKE